MQPVFRFAPSPNGYLHLGHAYSALLNQKLARESKGRLLLRIEDIDTVRCRPDLIEATCEDLAWLGLEWEEPVLRQSQHFARYAAALDRLDARGLIYPCFCSRKQIAAAGQDVPRDPDGAPLYPGTCRRLGETEQAAKRAAGLPYALRLDSRKAMACAGHDPLTWSDALAGVLTVDPLMWGDVVLARKEMPTSYHLAVVLDDAMQGVTDVVRGQDLFAATAVHRIVQALLGLPTPRYHHHGLIADQDGRKLAKSHASKPIRQWRQEGASAADLRHRLGFD